MAGTLLGAAALSVVACGGGGKRTVNTSVEGVVFDISPALLAVRPSSDGGGADTLVNLGTLSEGEVVRYDARLRNAGAEPLVITGIDTTCGCTSVSHDKKPIKPGATGKFSFSLDSRGMWGLQMKLIDINTSAAERPFRIMIMARVEESTKNGNE
jgi:hypothetical protein